MKKYFIIAAAALSMAACNKVESVFTLSEKAEVRLSFTGTNATRADIQTADEAQVNSIQAFVFNGGSLDAYANASSTEIAAREMSLSCTQGAREIWVIVNAPVLSSVTTLAGLRNSVSQLTADNSAAGFVMVGRKSDTIGASYATTIGVDRIVSRVRLFQVKRDMANAALQTVDFKVIRAYMSCVRDNACYDIYTPAAPVSAAWLNCRFADSGAISTTNAFIYNKLASPAVLSNGDFYGNLYESPSSVAAQTFYVYPNDKASREDADPETWDQTKLVVECQIGTGCYTYPIPLGEIGCNKTYDIKLLTITKLGNESDGDDTIEDGEDDVITSTTATFTITVNDWTQVLTFGGVTDGNITI